MLEILRDVKIEPFEKPLIFGLFLNFLFRNTPEREREIFGSFGFFGSEKNQLLQNYEQMQTNRRRNCEKSSFAVLDFFLPIWYYINMSLRPI